MVSKFIIHKIEKETGKTEASPTYSTELIKVNQLVTHTIETLNKSFSKDDKVMKSEFKEDEETFQLELNSYLENKNDFHTFSKKATKSLAKEMRHVAFATGGFLVYAEYIYLKKNIIGVFLVRESDEITFKEGDSGHFIIGLTKVINSNKLALAVRIDVTKYLSKDMRYLSFTHGQDRVSDYFIDWLYADISARSNDDSQSLMKLIKNLEKLPLNPETQKEFEVNEFREKVLKSIESSGYVIRLTELGKQFWNDPDFIINEAERKDISINHEFRAIKSIVARLKKYKISEGKVEISFTQADINNSTIYEGEDDLLVIDSEKIRKEFLRLKEE